MIAHGDEQIKEQLSPNFHLHLHCSTSFEGGSAADDQGQVVCSKLRVTVGSGCVGISGTGQDGAALDAGL